MANSPKATDLYGTDSPVVAAQKHEEYLGALTESIAKGISGETTVPGMTPQVSPAATLESLVSNASVTKSMSPEALSSLTTALDTMRSDIVKDITTTNPISTGLVAFDLEAPAKLIAPRPTPLRNKIVRKKGVGLAHRFKVIDGYTGTGTGSQGNIFPGITDTSTDTFGSTTTYNRGKKITYNGYDKVVNYKQFSLSDNVPFSAQFSGQGYQDIRQLAQTTTLYSSMLMEERMLLTSRGTDTGFVGALAKPDATTNAITLTARAAGTGEVGLASGVYYVSVVADSGDFGGSVASNIITSASVTAGNVLDVKIGTDVAGALGYEIFASQTTGAANLIFQGRTGYNVFTLGASALITTGTNTADKYASDTSAYATGYDGIMPIILANGVNNRINSALSTTNPGVEFQSVFATLYSNVKADPDEILMNGLDRKQLSDAIKGSASNVGAYRLNIQQSELDGVAIGDVVQGIHNEVTGKFVNVQVHPWMPQGNSAVLSYTLPIPDTQVSEVWSVVNVQDYMGIEWPVVDFNYSNSTYWNGTFVCYAPTFNGVVTGIKAV